MSIPNKISFYRKKNGMTQDELARMLGVSRQFVSSIEGAKKIPSIKLAFQLSDIFGVPVDNLFYR